MQFQKGDCEIQRNLDTLFYKCDYNYQALCLLNFFSMGGGGGEGGTQLLTLEYQYTVSLAKIGEYLQLISLHKVTNMLPKKIGELQPTNIPK